jgi:hypothetical protein
MTFNNSILLILKNDNGLHFNELLSRISSRYSNQKSAYSALCRAIKNLDSFGQIRKKDSRIYITDKGLASIQIEMKEKLVLKLNEILKKPIENIEELVQLLIVFTERANESNDLLQNAKENAQFTIKDISVLQEKIEQHQEALQKMCSLIGVQEERLRELNFNDVIEIKLDKKFVKRAKNYLEKEKLIIETLNPELLERLPEVLKKGDSFIVENEFLDEVFSILLSEQFSDFVLYLPKIKCIASKGTIKCYGSFKELKNF